MALKVGWSHALEISKGFVKNAYRSGERGLCPVVYSVLFANGFEFGGEGLVMIVTDAWE